MNPSTTLSGTPAGAQAEAHPPALASPRRPAPLEVDHDRPLIECLRCGRFTENLVQHAITKGRCRPRSLA